MRRKPGALVPLELSIIEAVLDLRGRGVVEAYGFLLAKELQDKEGARMLIAYGTMYKALGRMEKAGLLTSRWEDPLIAADERRPRRRLYRVTAAGQKAHAEAPPLPASSRVGPEPGGAVS